MDGIQRRDAVPRDAPAVTAVLAAAFRDGAVAHWLDPDPETRPRHSVGYFGPIVDSAIAVGVARLAEADGEIVAAALWFSFPGPALPADDVVEPDEAIAPEVLARLRALERVVAERHPAGDRHDYLTFLGVHPARQGWGIGGALLADHHARLDAGGVPAYLEADDARNRQFYRRHGYADRGDPIVLDGRALMWPMWRPPGGPRPRR